MRTSWRTSRSTPATSGECEPMSEMLSGAEILCRALVDAGVEVIFGYPGGAIMPFYHALPDHPQLRHILVRHEQAAAHAADGYARASGRVGVCVATSGPGATNLVTGLAAAHMDNSPVVAITGQVSRPMIGRDAFQETDIIGITLPITKQNYQVQDVTELAAVVAEAMAVAVEGRPGPVLIDVPKDVQNQKTEWKSQQSTEAFRDPRAGARGQRRPPLTPGASPGSVEDGIRQAARLIAGEVHVNRAIQNADVIIGIGLRFDDRVTGNTASFAPQARIVHIDLDRSEIGKNVPVSVGIVGDARDITRRLVAAVEPRRCERWLEHIRGFVRTRTEAYRGDLSPEAILASIYEASHGDCTIVTDVGQHQMWVAKLYPYQRPNTHITSGGLGAMGFAVPAAMGVHLARPNGTVWAISGDGGFQMNMAEMATMVQEGLPVKMAVFNNGYLGMVRQWQQFFHGKRYSCTPIWSPDYIKLAEAYGIPGWRVKQAAELWDVVAQANDHPGPALVEFVIEQEANVYPMIPPGGSLSEPIEAEPATAAGD